MRLWNRPRTEYSVALVINGRSIKKVVIDPHYRNKHAESIDDDIILNLVMLLNEGRYEAEAKVGCYSYYVAHLYLRYSPYRLIFLLEDGNDYIGVINGYRTERKRS